MHDTRGDARELAPRETMKDAVERLNAEYGLNLSEEDMEIIARQAEAAHRLFHRLYEVDTERLVPALRIDPAQKR
jgi:hypothetical protein